MVRISMVRIRHSAHIVLVSMALLVFTACATLGPSSSSNPQAQSQQAADRIQAANTALQRGHADAALKQLGALPPSLPPDVQQQALDLQARAQLALGHRVDAARVLAKRALLLPPAAQAAEHQRVVAILAGLGSAGLNALFPTLAGNDPLKPYVSQALAHSGKATPLALPQLNEPVGTLTGASAPQGFAMPAHVALLLPATGPGAVASAAVRDGFFAAYFHTPAT
ncbi:MAG: penicillin-binding protein activator, partial [Xanthomonadaceae bacterium]|nr:penicillin-binding protein activator [Xanthomonadaceae bacterium]